MSDTEGPTPQSGTSGTIDARQQAWQSGYGDGMADTIKRYNIRVIDEDPQGHTIQMVLGLLLAAALVGYVAWMSVSRPHVAEVVPNG
jgi:hypothetical protein